MGPHRADLSLTYIRSDVRLLLFTDPRSVKDLVMHHTICKAHIIDSDKLECLPMEHLERSNAQWRGFGRGRGARKTDGLKHAKQVSEFATRDRSKGRSITACKHGNIERVKPGCIDGAS
jgi:hypothetical protein